MQLDLFEHSRDVMLRNAAIDALQRRDVAAGADAIRALESGNAADRWLPALRSLHGRLCMAMRCPLDRVSAGLALQATDAVVPLAEDVFGAAAGRWLAPLWAELAAAVADLPFDAREEALHAAPLLLRAGEWAEAGARAETIARWRFIAAPLAWKVESECRVDGLERGWPLLCELAWMDPRRAEALASRLRLRELNGLLDRFDAEFEGAGEADDFAWFPAWALIAEPRFASGVRAAMRGESAPERCARLVAELLRLEREGRHVELIEARRKLRDARPALFARYMRTR